MKNTGHKLFLVHFNGMDSAYVIANDPTSAYKSIRKYFDTKNLGFTDDRALRSIELLAEDNEYPEAKARLFFVPEPRISDKD